MKRPIERLIMLIAADWIVVCAWRAWKSTALFSMIAADLHRARFALKLLDQLAAVLRRATWPIRIGARVGSRSSGRSRRNEWWLKRISWRAGALTRISRIADFCVLRRRARGQVPLPPRDRRAYLRKLQKTKASPVSAHWRARCGWRKTRKTR